MTQKRLFHDKPIVDKDEILVRGSAAHHLATVLRVKRGERIEVLDGLGSAWLGEVSGLGTDGVTIRRLHQQSLVQESPLSLTLALAYARSDRMELVLRQAIELGVSRVVPFRAARSQYGLNDVQLNQRTMRWERIAREALRQSGRTRLPSIEPMADVDALLANLPKWGCIGDDCLCILAWEGERQQGLMSVWEDCPQCVRVIVVVGPEGGFTPREAELFRTSGFRSVSLGPRTLRLETAATALLAMTQLLWGDLAKQITNSRTDPKNA
jgi:16S rRNA (uracil1498-N3)-methyltransferase